MKSSIRPKVATSINNPVQTRLMTSRKMPSSPAMSGQRCSSNEWIVHHQTAKSKKPNHRIVGPSGPGAEFNRTLVISRALMKRRKRPEKVPSVIAPKTPARKASAIFCAHGFRGRF